MSVQKQPYNYSLIGYPLGHTMSPIVHKKMFELSKITDFSYGVTEIKPAELEKETQNLKRLSGYNITIPYKQEIIKYIDKLDESALRYNAVNCVLNKDNMAVGYNTDCFGFVNALQAEGVSLGQDKCKKILVLGFGGAGRMAAIESALSGCDVTVAVRNPDKVTESIENITVRTFDDVSGEYDLLVNSTPVGMFPNIDGSPVSENVIRNCKAVFDLVYNPRKTQLLAIAEQCGVKAIGGMGMLVWQAAKAHEIWYNAKFSDEDVSAVIKNI